MDSFKSLPPPGYQRKVYIIDEVHMLSISAFNALLKSLEEPPPHTVFILATTDVHKIPETVISRCQRHDFRALSLATIEARLQEVCELEKITTDAESLKLVARMADGSMRDAQTLLDRVQSFCEGEINALETSRALGTVDRKILQDLAQGIITRDSAIVLKYTTEIFSTGIDPATLLREFVHFWREVFVAKAGGESQLAGLGLGKDSIVDLLRLVASLEVSDVQDLWDVARDGADRALRSSHPRYGFEALVVRMSTRIPVAEVGALIGQLGGSGERKPQAPAARVAQQVAPAVQAMPAAHVARETQPAPVTNRAVEAAPVGGGGNFVWADVVSFVAETGGRVLLENLKRIRPTRCEVGVFEATGPEFTATSLMREKAKVTELFDAFLEKRGIAKPRGWKIAIVKGAGAVDANPAAAQKARSSGDAELQGHPAVQSLQKIFPGSKVEQVRVKE
jgi:DNA polymerase-3 subunit gamma/tau